MIVSEKVDALPEIDPASTPPAAWLKDPLTDALKKLRTDIPRIVDRLGMEAATDIRSWMNVVNGKLLPRLSPDFPLMVAVCGGGSSGKSTLFNSLVGDRLSPSGGSAGINRRILVSAPGELFRQKEFVTTLFRPFGAESKPLEDQCELTRPGCPLYILNSNVPRNMVLLDTPDFDTGARGSYTNRDVVRQALETADILIYLFTNSNYNNRDNTDFISQVLTGIGMRKCFLVYRVYAMVDNREVTEHAMTVARHIYGDNAERYVMGIYRTDEDNAVAAGEKFMEMRPTREEDPPFNEALKELDPRVLRPELMASILDSVLNRTRTVVEQAEQSRDGLRLYLDALQAAQSRSVQEALQHFPMDMILNRFSEIWMETDPSHIKAMRSTGNYIGMPFKALSGAARWVGRRVYGGRREARSASADFREHIEEDLLNAVSSLHRKALNPEIAVTLPETDPVARRMADAIERIRAEGRFPFDNEKEATPEEERQTAERLGPLPRMEPGDEKGTVQFRVPAHPAVAGAQADLEQRNWKQSVDRIMEQKEAILQLSDTIENDLVYLAQVFRKRMKFPDKIRQTVSAFMNVLPATVAVTYILSTGDPVGAAGIKVKLTGLFGLHDLYALVALPATTGLTQADRRQLETLLRPIAQAWLNANLQIVQEIFEKEVVGGLIQAAEATVEETEPLIQEIESTAEAIETGRKAVIPS